MRTRHLRIAGVIAAAAAIVVVSFSAAFAQGGRTERSAHTLVEVKVVRHSFSPPTYPNGQWTIQSTNSWVAVPGASTSVTIPSGEQDLLIVRFSPGMICAGTGDCLTRILISGSEGQPAKPVDFNAVGGSHWGMPYTERSIGPLPAGTYTVLAQVEATVGSNGTTLTMRSFHLTVERFRL